eukprot:TRINITY_DN51934_c0_g1_i1.p1 TRINITY_DN51934_c0_g1~~TRINITY_DN51934_c0_g1_i1.p1  ORF type:complete len:134 (-),score=42.42 TRINITY_DN51934_c0_g1_i1:37-438(-)
MCIRDSIGSGICAEKEHSRQYTSHRQRLSNIKPAIDNKAPPVYPHLYQKLKKAQLEEERCAAIERDNRTLVNRMSRIMKRTGIDNGKPHELSLIHISEPTRLLSISYAVFCLKKKNKNYTINTPDILNLSMSA